LKRRNEAQSENGQGMAVFYWQLDPWFRPYFILLFPWPRVPEASVTHRHFAKTASNRGRRKKWNQGRDRGKGRPWPFLTLGAHSSMNNHDNVLIQDKKRVVDLERELWSADVALRLAQPIHEA
jgi:hypothetical protein